jgi:hypothetical protein
MDVRGELVDPEPFRVPGREDLNKTFKVIRIRCLRDSGRQLFEEPKLFNYWRV